MHHPSGMQSPWWLDASLLVQTYHRHANHARLSTCSWNICASCTLGPWQIPFPLTGMRLSCSYHMASSWANYLLSEASARSESSWALSIPPCTFLPGMPRTQSPDYSSAWLCVMVMLVESNLEGWSGILHATHYKNGKFPKRSMPLLNTTRGMYWAWDLSVPWDLGQGIEGRAWGPATDMSLYWSYSLFCEKFSHLSLAYESHVSCQHPWNRTRLAC